MKICAVCKRPRAQFQIFVTDYTDKHKEEFGNELRIEASPYDFSATILVHKDCFNSLEDRLTVCGNSAFLDLKDEDKRRLEK